MSKSRAVFVGLATAFSTMLAMYVLVVRRWILGWGATRYEAQRELPGDEIVPQVRYVSTRAITINAPPGAIWPWIVQMGQGRGGLYSYDWLENLVGCDIHSADRVLPEYQALAPGDHVRLVSESLAPQLYLEVHRSVPERTLVLRTPGEPRSNLKTGSPNASWAFVLEPLSDQRTRLLVRWRSTYNPTVLGMLGNQYLLEPVHFLMEQKQMRGIKARAERLAQTTPR